MCTVVIKVNSATSSTSTSRCSASIRLSLASVVRVGSGPEVGYRGGLFWDGGKLAH